MIDIKDDALRRTTRLLTRSFGLQTDASLS